VYLPVAFPMPLARVSISSVGILNSIYSNGTSTHRTFTIRTGLRYVLLISIACRDSEYSPNGDANSAPARTAARANSDGIRAVEVRVGGVRRFHRARISEGRADAVPTVQSRYSLPDSGKYVGSPSSVPKEPLRLVSSFSTHINRFGDFRHQFPRFQSAAVEFQPESHLTLTVER
jgi:hypothetical protein